jgi:streptogramin lyase
VLGRGIGPLAAEGSTVWVANPISGALLRVGPGSFAAARLGGTPTSLALGSGRVWVAERDADRVAAVDARTLAQLTSTGVPLPVRVLAAPLGVWALSLDTASLYQLDPVSGAGGRRVDAPVADPVDMLAVGSELWVLGAGEHGLSPLSAPLGRSVRAGFDRPGVALAGLSVEGSTIWMAEPTQRALLRVDTANVTVKQFPAPDSIEPTATAPGACGVWVGDAGGNLAMIDPASGRTLTAPLRIGRSLGALAASGTGVWASDPLDGTLVRVELRPGA